MRTGVLILLMVFLFPTNVLSQNTGDLEQIEYISPFHDELAAVKKGEQWAFINDQGKLMVDFRSDFIIDYTTENHYPFFSDGLALISEKRDGITYFGFIGKDGSTIIEPRFLNARPFNNGMALVIELVRQNVGTNDLLDKPLVSYNYFEALIGTDGKVIHYLSDKPTHVTLDKEYLRKPPELTTKVLSEGLIATLNKDKTWTIKRIE